MVHIGEWTCNGKDSCRDNTGTVRGIRVSAISPAWGTTARSARARASASQVKRVSGERACRDNTLPLAANACNGPLLPSAQRVCEP
jgi:hypothetical protein